MDEVVPDGSKLTMIFYTNGKNVIVKSWCLMSMKWNC